MPSWPSKTSTLSTQTSCPYVQATPGVQSTKGWYRTKTLGISTWLAPEFPHHATSSQPLWATPFWTKAQPSRNANAEISSTNLVARLRKKRRSTGRISNMYAHWTRWKSIWVQCIGRWVGKSSNGSLWLSNAWNKIWVSMRTIGPCSKVPIWTTSVEYWLNSRRSNKINTIPNPLLHHKNSSKLTHQRLSLKAIIWDRGLTERLPSPTLRNVR